MYKQFLKQGFKVNTFRKWSEYRLLIRAYNAKRDIWSHGKDTTLDDIYPDFPGITPAVIYSFEKHLAWLLSQPEFIVTQDLVLEDRMVTNLNVEEYDLDWQTAQTIRRSAETRSIFMLTQIGIMEGSTGKYYADLHFHRMNYDGGTGAGLLKIMERAVTIDTYLFDN